MFAAAVSRHHSCASGVPLRCRGNRWSCFQLWQVHHFPARRWCFTCVCTCSGKFTTRLALTAELKRKASCTCLSSCDKLLFSVIASRRLTLCCTWMQYTVSPAFHSTLRGLLVTLAGLSVCLICILVGCGGSLPMHSMNLNSMFGCYRA